MTQKPVVTDVAALHRKAVKLQWNGIAYLIEVLASFEKRRLSPESLTIIFRYPDSLEQKIIFGKDTGDASTFESLEKLLVKMERTPTLRTHWAAVDFSCRAMAEEMTPYFEDEHFMAPLLRPN